MSSLLFYTSKHLLKIRKFSFVLPILILFVLCGFVAGCSGSSSGSGNVTKDNGKVGFQFVKHPFFSKNSLSILEKDAAESLERIELDFYQLKDGVVPETATFSRSINISPKDTTVSISSVPAPYKYEIVGRIFKTNNNLPYSKFRTAVEVLVNQETTCTAVLTSGVLRSIDIKPNASNASIPMGYSQQFTATGIYSDNTTLDITSQVTWSSTNSEIAKLNAEKSGLFTGVNPGSCDILAKDPASEISASVNTTVTSEPTLLSISLEPNKTNLPLGITQNYKAVGIFSGNITKDLSNDVVWSVSDESILSLNATQKGTCKAIKEGSCVLTALDSLSQMKAELTINVTEIALVSISLEPTTVELPKGVTCKFTALGTYSDGTTQDLTTSATWSSSDLKVVFVDNTVADKGKALTVNPGTASITASYTQEDGSLISGKANITVKDVTVKTLTVTPNTVQVSPGNTQQFTALATFSDDTSLDVTKETIWTSSNTQSVTVSSADGTQGLAFAVSSGSSTITAEYGTTKATATITVSAGKTITSITVTPGFVNLFVGSSQQYTAKATYSDGTSADITTSATWVSTDTEVAVVELGTTVVASLVGKGNATITATFKGVSGTGSVNAGFGLVFTNCSIPTSQGDFSAKVKYTKDTDAYTYNATLTPTIIDDTTIYIPLDAIDATSTIKVMSATVFHKPTGKHNYAFEWWDKTDGVNVNVDNTETVDITTNEFAGGTGTSGDPYKVANPRQLDNVRNNLAAYYTQIKDIDFAGSCGLTATYNTATNKTTFTRANTEAPFYNNGAGWIPIGTDDANFAGSYNGNGYGISNMLVNVTADTDDTFAVGLFGYLSGILNHISINSDCFVSANLAPGSSSTALVGGVVGCLPKTVVSTGTVTKCKNSGTVTASGSGDAQVGGILGFSGGAILTISHLVNTGIISAVCDESVYCGGICGTTNDIIEIAFNSGSVFAKTTAGGFAYAGGIVGNLNGSVHNAFNGGDVFASSASGKVGVGGLVGFAYQYRTTSYTYNYGALSAEVAPGQTKYIGGIAGESNSTSYNHNFYLENKGAEVGVGNVATDQPNKTYLINIGQITNEEDIESNKLNTILNNLAEPPTWVINNVGDDKTITDIVPLNYSILNGLF